MKMLQILAQRHIFPIHTCVCFILTTGIQYNPRHFLQLWSKTKDDNMWSKTIWMPFEFLFFLFNPTLMEISWQNISGASQGNGIAAFCRWWGLNDAFSNQVGMLYGLSQLFLVFRRKLWCEAPEIKFQRKVTGNSQNSQCRWTVPLTVYPCGFPVVYMTVSAHDHPTDYYS